MEKQGCKKNPEPRSPDEFSIHDLVCLIYFKLIINSLEIFDYCFDVPKVTSKRKWFVTRRKPFPSSKSTFLSSFKNDILIMKLFSF